jgi:F-type H+-transporting ATPase subunit b
MLDEKFWLAICFGIFVLLTYRPIKKAILGMLDGEIARIRKDLETSEAARIEAEKGFEELESELKKIIAERIILIKKAKDDASEVALENTKELENIIKRKERDAAASLTQVGNSAATEVRSSLIKAAKELAEEYAIKHKKDLPSDTKIADMLLQPK